MSPSLLLTVVAVFSAVALITGYVTASILSAAGAGRRRLRQTTSQPSTGVLIDSRTLTAEESAFFKRMSTLVPRSPKDMTALRRRLGRAGYYSLGSVSAFTVAQIVSPLLCAVVALWFVPPGLQKWLAAVAAGLVGYQIPSLWLYRQTVLRQKQIENGLPDLLDLLIVCLEAGAALDQAIIKASDELVLSYPALAEEFRMLVTETRAGKPRLEAFRNLASRTGVEDIRALVSMLVQTDRFGTSVANALRTHADVSRTKRRQRAEERAAKLGVKLVFPLVFMLFPAFFVVTLGPAVIQFVRVFFGQMAGQ
jgi:tight adherence protein C